MILETFDQDRFGKTMYESGFEEGVEEVAMKMIESNEPIDKIIAYTGLTREAVEKIINEK